MVTREQIEALISRVRPLLQADAGGIELLHAAADTATIRLIGACDRQVGHGTLHLGLETALREELPDLGELHIVCECSAPVAAPDAPTDSIVVGISARMRAVFGSLDLLQHSEGSVLITGETGTGKEVTAMLIHRSSPRAQKPFVAVSCALFSETLIESELFGHERGAFTGAIGTRPGRFELADGGTIFLDDIDDVPVSIQVKLLRVLQNRTIERVGGNRTIPVNVRFIAGTKRNLKGMVADGAFRADLFYRLNVFPVALPPLRERLEDIPALVDHFLRRSCRRRGRPVPAVSGAVLKAFRQYPWPGNIRELENTCEWIAQTCAANTIRISCIPPSILFQAGIQPGQSPASGPMPAAGPVPSPVPVSFDGRMQDLERSLLEWALEASNGNKSRAAELLQMKRSTLSDHLRRHGLQPVDAGSHSPRLTPNPPDGAHEGHVCQPDTGTKRDLGKPTGNSQRTSTRAH